jgi:hypothetical protein
MTPGGKMPGEPGYGPPGPSGQGEVAPGAEAAFRDGGFQFAEVVAVARVGEDGVQAVRLAHGVTAVMVAASSSPLVVRIITVRRGEAAEGWLWPMSW